MVKYNKLRGVAQLVERSAGGREDIIAGSSPVTPTSVLTFGFNSD